MQNYEATLSNGHRILVNAADRTMARHGISRMLCGHAENGCRQRACMITGDEAVRSLRKSGTVRLPDVVVTELGWVFF